MNKKKLILIMILLIVGISIISLIICQKSKLTDEERWALECVNDLKNMMNDEDSFRIEDDILIFDYIDEYDERYNFTFIPYSANNGFGSRTKDCAVFNYGVYLSNYSDEGKIDEDNRENKEEVKRILTFLNSKVALEKYNCGELKDINNIQIVDDDRIKNKVK